MRLEFGAWWLVWYDSTSHRIYQQSYEPNTQAFLRGFLKTGMTVLDIGAHHGFYTLLAARCVGLVGKVTAFEPSPRERRRLIWHVRLNRCPQVLVEPFALSDSEPPNGCSVWLFSCRYYGTLLAHLMAIQCGSLIR